MIYFVIAAFPAILMAMIPGRIAANRGHSGLTWGLYGVVLFPVAFIHSLFLERQGWAAEWAEISKGKCRCSECAEWVFEQARRCPHCTAVFGEPLASQTAEDPNWSEVEELDVPPPG